MFSIFSLAFIGALTASHVPRTHVKRTDTAGWVYVKANISDSNLDIMKNVHYIECAGSIQSYLLKCDVSPGGKCACSATYRDAYGNLAQPAQCSGNSWAYGHDAYKVCGVWVGAINSNPKTPYCVTKN